MRVCQQLALSVLLITTAVGSAWAQLCSQPPSNCQPASGLDIRNSTRAGIRRAADDFRVSTPGVVTSLCWRGNYSDQACATSPGDDFRVVYYATDLGLPAAVIGGPFSQSGGTLTVQRAATGALVQSRPEYEYVASHAGVSFATGTCYWVEITNGGGGFCSWYWETAGTGDQRAVVDLNDSYTNADVVALDFGFCLSLPLAALTSQSCIAPPVTNNFCSGPTSISCGAVIAADNRLATTIASDPVLPCYTNGTSQGHGTIWYSYVAESTTAEISTCSSTAPDTLVALYSGNCTTPLGIGCSDNVAGCGVGSRGARLCASGLNIGETYLIEVASRDSASRGPLELRLSCDCTPLCTVPVTKCQTFGLNSTWPELRTADEFRVATSGTLDDLCVWGSYADNTPNAVEQFEINFYNTAVGGYPYQLIHHVSQAAGTLTLLDRRPVGYALAAGPLIYEYHFAYSGFSFTGDECYWLEVRNLAAAHPWRWTDALPGAGSGFCAVDRGADGAFDVPWDRGLGDKAWCLDAPLVSAAPCVAAAPANVTCAQAAPVNCATAATEVIADNLRSTGVAPVGLCTPAVGALWYAIVATSEPIRVRTCGTPASGDTVVALYGQNCGALELLACSNDGCGALMSDLAFSEPIPDATYYVLFATATDAARGAYRLEFDCAAPLCLRGDANADGLVNNFDIDAFVLAIVDPLGYVAQYGAAALACNDANNDGAVNNFDIDTFVACILNLPPPGQGCP